MIRLTSTDAVTAEALDEGVMFEWRGEVFTTLAPLDMPVEILEIGEDDALATFRLMLGDEEWQRFRAMRPTLRDLRSFGEALSEASGMGDPGN